MNLGLQTAWQGMDLVVTKNDREIDRLPAQTIQRVLLVCHGNGDTPGDLAFAVIETSDETLVLPAESGIAGRIHFERQSFWSERPCIYWVNASHAALPRRLRPGLWMLWRQRPGYMRLPRAELASTIEHWPLEGPQTWEQRKWERIARSRLLAPLDAKQRAREQARR